MFKIDDVVKLVWAKDQHPKLSSNIGVAAHVVGVSDSSNTFPYLVEFTDRSARVVCFWARPCDLQATVVERVPLKPATVAFTGLTPWHYIAKDRNGEWYSYEQEPTRGENSWWSTGDYVDLGCLTITFDGPWDRSLHQVQEDGSLHLVDLEEYIIE